MIASIRPSPIAGTWYPGDAQRLAEAVDGYLAAAALPPLDGEAVGVIAPHAGYRYSGAVAGYAFAAVRGRSPSVVAVCSPMHAPYLSPLLTTAHDAYETPLGEILVDKKSLRALDALLREKTGVELSPVANDPEHSLEIELPFLQRALSGDFLLLPVMVRSRDPRVVEALGLSLAEVLRGQDALLVASTDLSHFYPQPVAEQLDAEMLRQIESFSPEGMFRAEAEGRGYACGLGATAAVLWAARALGASSVKILRHATSGDVTGDTSSVVGYGAAVILKPS
jgi:AmmeMemoRadiSam system protein B